MEALDAIRFNSKLNVEPIIVEHDKLNKILDKYFTHEESFDFGDDDFDVDVMAGDDLAQNNDDDDEPSSEEEAPIVK